MSKLHLEPFVYTSNAKSITDISNNISLLGQIDTTYNMVRDQIVSNTGSIANSINVYTAKIDTDAEYTPVYGEKEKKTVDVILEDTDQMLLQQNHVYLFGSVTAATLIIAAIMISRS